jgi:hypothetical protein
MYNIQCIEDKYIIFRISKNCDETESCFRLKKFLILILPSSLKQLAIFYKKILHQFIC